MNHYTFIWKIVLIRNMWTHSERSRNTHTCCNSWNIWLEMTLGLFLSFHKPMLFVRVRNIRVGGKGLTSNKGPDKGARHKLCFHCSSNVTLDHSYNSQRVKQRKMESPKMQRASDLARHGMTYERDFYYTLCYFCHEMSGKNI